MCVGKGGGVVCVSLENGRKFLLGSQTSLYSKYASSECQNECFTTVGVTFTKYGKTMQFCVWSSQKCPSSSVLKCVLKSDTVNCSLGVTQSNVRKCLRVQGHAACDLCAYCHVKLDHDCSVAPTIPAKNITGLIAGRLTSWNVNYCSPLPS